MCTNCTLDTVLDNVHDVLDNVHTAHFYVHNVDMHSSMDIHHARQCAHTDVHMYTLNTVLDNVHIK